MNDVKELTKDKIIKTRVTVAEYRRLQDAADAKGITLSRLIREALKNVK